MPKLSAWHDITPVSLHLPDANDFEPSGLTLYTDDEDTWLFVVGDSGKVIKYDISAGRWHGPDTFDASEIPVALNDDSLKPTDFECVTFAHGNIMIGVEGDRPYDDGSDDDSDDARTPPHILRFDQDKDGGGNRRKVGELTGSSWNLTDLVAPGAKKNAGMEGLTFLPNGSFPAAWSDGGHYGGIFLATTQASGGAVRAYCLVQGSDPQGKTRQDLDTTAILVGDPDPEPLVLTVPEPSEDDPLISELFFDTKRGYLWVLYDGGSESDYLQALSLDPTDGTLTQVWADEVPWIGVEGMAIHGDDLYLAIDDNLDEDVSDDGVYVLSGFVAAALSTR